MICRNIRGPHAPREEGQVGERIDLLFDLDLYIIIARTCVGNRCCIICITCITCVRIAGRLGGSKRTPASSAKWKAVPRCILWSPFSRSWRKVVRPSRLNFTDRGTQGDETFSSCLAAIVGDGKRQAHVFTISGGDIYTRRTNRFY